MNSITFEKQCGCGLNPFGNSYCPNIYTSTYTSLLAKVSTKLTEQCHTLNRHDVYSCLTPNVKNEQDFALLNEFIIEKHERD
jgi:hypothetical protein